MNENNINLKAYLFLSVLLIAILILGITFKKMKPGIGPHNLKVLGLISIAIFSALLAFASDSSVQAAFGIFGVIAGYLFGSSANAENDVDINSNGNDNQIAGRDINNYVERMFAQIKNELQLSSKKSYHIYVLYK